MFAYIVGGTYTKASASTGIPWETIREWKRAQPDWWEKVSEEAWNLYDEQIRVKYGEIIEESASQLIDRLKHGDKLRDKDGAEYRQAVKAIDLAKIMGITQDKLSISMGKPTSISAKAESTKDRLEELRALMGEMSTRGEIAGSQPPIKERRLS